MRLGLLVYREETSACHGNDKGPNPVLRTESVCATCANFAVTGKHRPVWEGPRARNAELLTRPALDPKSCELAQARITECDRILVQLDQDIVKHGKKEQVDKAVSQYDKRLRDTHRRLCNAIERLITGRSNDPAPQKTQNHSRSHLSRTKPVLAVTPSTPIIAPCLMSFVKAALKVTPKATQREDKPVEQRTMIDALKLNKRRIIIENAVLLKPALDSEAQADRHCKQNARLIAERDAGLRAVSITSKKRW